MTPSPKRAFVIGGTRGIGARTVATLTAQGWPVAYTGRTAVDGAIACDVTDAASVARAFDAAEAALGGKPEAIVLSAGINVPPAPLGTFPADRFAELVAVNVTGAFHVLSEAARRIEDGGAIVGVGTSMVRRAMPNGGPYTASKAAMEALIRSAAVELAPRGVRVNAVSPGPVDTDLFRSGKSEEQVAGAAGLSPMARVGTPDEVAAVIAFLLFDAASWITGQIVQPNGGMV